MLAACSEEIQSAQTQSELNYQNYLYGGKELDRKFGINAYDFTGRYYDITDNRFWSMDPMAEKNYDVSPYAYCKNNPINRTDPSGMLDISKTTREEFPEFSEFIDNISSVYRNNGEVFQSALKETSSLNDSEINDALKKDNGPNLVVINLDKGEKLKNGATTPTKRDAKGKQHNIYNGKGLIKIDNNVAGIYEEAVKSGNESKILLATTLVVSTVFHEITHFGNLKKNESTNGKYGKIDSGDIFENKVYKRNINRNDYHEYTPINKKLPIR